MVCSILTSWDVTQYATRLIAYFDRQQGRTGWDQQSAHPALVALLSGPRADELGVPKSGRAVVPGCGRVSH